VSFSSKRLRVQIPCEDNGSVLEEAIGCPFEMVCHDGASFICDPNTCVFGRFSEVGPEGVQSCEQTPWNCAGFATPELPGPRTLVLDAEHLPRLREELEARLEEVRRAEQALADRGSDK
jgi:hypothetical protein